MQLTAYEIMCRLRTAVTSNQISYRSLVNPARLYLVWHPNILIVPWLGGMAIVFGGFIEPSICRGHKMTVVKLSQWRERD